LTLWAGIGDRRAPEPQQLAENDNGDSVTCAWRGAA
jgi:hypothetical protein